MTGKIITITFKSGSFWHGEYEVKNPEVIPGLNSSHGKWWKRYDKWLPIKPGSSCWDGLKDGDQITLPDGYGIKYTLSGRIEFKEVGHSEATTKTATITLTEKPENSAHGDTSEGGKIEKEYMDRMINVLIDKWNLPYKQARDVGRDLFYSFVFPVYELGGQFGCKVKTVEPSESQEETSDAYKNYVKSLLDAGERKGWNEALDKAIEIVNKEMEYSVDDLEYKVTERIIEELKRLKR